MKKMIFILVAVTIAACGTSNRINDLSNNTSTTSKKNRAKLPSSNATQIAIDVQYLSSDELMGRDTGSEGIEMAAKYLKERFESIGIQPYGDSYMQPFKNDKASGNNVVAVLNGSDKELMKETIVIGAHYDHIGIIQAVAGDSIANGANDNATGTASVMAIAEMFKKLDFNRRKVVFALFSAEEKGLVGSRELAKQMKASGENVVAMINLEMTGTPMVGKDYITYLTGYDTSNMGEIFNKENENRVVTAKLEAAAQMNLFVRSDNYAFYEVFKVPSQTLSTFDFTNFDEYHKVGDEISGVNAQHMSEVVDAVFPGIFFMVNEEGLKMNPVTNE
ncbi:Peptidase family M28 [Nonlabens sp. Hel1_33_55]|uniref:M20/M25/M40 family metallo-hydrolase n=1 Tax=Nonlabens sp. Hel1_33_55 TaxID=1336802 RepID=UPI000875EEBE|nr:M20/M25/M40 family metallo-hydrolase [Nonlabens sp. Hel1_33_55]SCY44839.1 Peptidase family M28 [Nonlabens sp. Hel1_33_55]